MNGQPPIDSRKAADIVAQAHQLAKVYTPDWSPRKGHPAEALVQLFGRLMEIVIDRLNRVPEKHFLAFLDAAGVSPLPPKAARAPVRFLLAAKAKQDGFIPKGTSLAAAFKNRPPVNFETEEDVIAVRSRIASAFAYTPQAGTYDSGVLLIEASAQNGRYGFSPFEGGTPVPHRLYIAHNSLFKAMGKTRIEISFSFDSPPENGSLFHQNLQWYCRLDGRAYELTPSPESAGDTVVFEDVSHIEAWPVGEETAHWIWGEITGPLTGGQTELLLKRITCRTAAGNLLPDGLIFNAGPLDAGREFYPFGERPKRYDTFFIACREAFSKAGSRITLSPVYAPGASSSVELNWEFWTGEMWKIFGKTTQSGPTADNTPYHFNDDTHAFTASGQELQIQFDCPAMAEAEINGRKNLWVRVRLMAGDYGSQARMELTEEGRKITNADDLRLSHYMYSPESFAPPVITSLLVSHGFEAPLLVEKLAIENNFIIEARTPEEGVRPFAAPTETLPGFYLGLDSALSPGKPISLYLAVARAPMDSDPIVSWSYWAEKGWKRLAVSDDTRNLTESGMVKFTAPADVAASRRFTDPAPRFWLRVTLESGDPTGFELAGVYLNTVWARQAVTIRREILGSSTETPEAVFTLARTPVLEEQQIEVLEAEPPTTEELASLRQEEGEAVMTAADAPRAGSSAVWVRWHEVDDFRLSGPKSRHYQLDRASGRITFGDGLRGMVPPAGRDNIRARIYQSGGSAQGNVPAGSITVLKRAIPFIDAVVNVQAAGGGSAMEDAEALSVRGPRSLKHRSRSVTWEDYEWLAGEASFQVARARCLPATGTETAGKVTLVIVPASEDAKPFPNQGLIRQVRRHIQAGMIPTAELIIDGPKYITVAIAATVFPERPERADFVRGLVEERLQTFFHPLKGGPEEKGWDFGRDVHISEVCKVIEETEGVHHAEDVAVCSAFYEDGAAVLSQRTGSADNAALLEHVAVKDDYLVASGGHWIEVPGALTAFPIDEAPFIANTRTREIHNRCRLRPNCRVSDISKENVKYFLCLSAAVKEGFDVCGWCFGRQYSLR